MENEKLKEFLANSRRVQKRLQAKAETHMEEAAPILAASESKRRENSPQPSKNTK